MILSSCKKIKDSGKFKQIGTTINPGSGLNSDNVVPLRKGDIIVSSGAGHIGICDGTNCKPIISNSSSQHKIMANFPSAFSWVQSYPKQPLSFYRANDCDY
jgi:hypothetical protein